MEFFIRNALIKLNDIKIHKKTNLVEYPSGEDSLYEVIHYEDSAKIERLSVFHQFRSQNFAKVSVRQAYRQGWEGAAHHYPIAYPGIWKQKKNTSFKNKKRYKIYNKRQS